MKPSLIIFSSILIGFCPAAHAGKWAPVPVEAAAAASDYVVVATVAGVTADPAIQLTVERWIKGQASSVTLIAEPPPLPANGSVRTLLSPSLVGQRGIWFLRAQTTGTVYYQILPLVSGAYQAGDLFLPVASSASLAQQAAGLNQQLLTSLVAWYQGLTQPSPIDDLRLLASFENWRPGVKDIDQQVLVTGAAPLTGSVVVSQHLIGLVISVRLGIDSALTSVAAELSTLSANAKFPLINEAIAAYPHDVQAIPNLAALAGLHSLIAGLDNAVSTALDRIDDKTVAPVMVTMLDSYDSQAQLRAAAFLGRYALFADAYGNVPSAGAPDGPFATPQTRQYMPGATAGLTTADYVSFWKGWWAANRNALGFAP